VSSNRHPTGRASAKPEGFPKTERIRKSDEYTYVLQNGRRLRGRFVSAYWTRSEDAPEDAPNRVGIAAGKRLGTAPVRNRLKRHIREAYRRNKRELPCRGFTIVFLATPSMIGRSWDDVQTDIRSLLHRIAAPSG
jgi:ribonuclease P protein component